MIEMKIESIRVSLMSPNQVVILKEVDGDRRLPIFIGKTEGDAVAFHLNGMAVPRPLTHDLAASILTALDARASHVLISDLRNQHFYATIILNLDDTEVMLDARPSDAIAIAVRVGCPIFVEEHVMEEVGVRPSEQASASEKDLGAFGDFISSLDLSDLSDSDKDK
jgi:bifunctional DNase/RNase